MAVKIILLASLLLITLQDFKSYAVLWVLFPLFALCGAWLCLQEFSWQQYGLYLAINLGLVMLVLGLLLGYAKLKLKRPLLEVFGLGDVLFFMGMAFLFPTISFLIFFVFSLLFSLIISLFLKSIYGKTHLPLAGCMSIFLVAIYLSQWFGWSPNIYGF